VFDVFSVKRMYNIKVSTGKNTWFLLKIDDDGGGDELDYSFLNIMSLVQPLSSASYVVLLKLSALIMAPPGQTGRQRQCVLNLFDRLSVHPSVTKLVKTIFWKWLNRFTQIFISPYKKRKKYIEKMNWTNDRKTQIREHTWHIHLSMFKFTLFYP